MIPEPAYKRDTEVLLLVDIISILHVRCFAFLSAGGRGERREGRRGEGREKGGGR